MLRILVVVALLALAPVAYANPLLVCDPAPAGEEWTHFVVSEGGSEIARSDYSEEVIDGKAVAIVMDMAGTTDGQHDLQVQSCNVWGCSSMVPFSFNRALPGSPTAIKLRRR